MHIAISIENPSDRRDRTVICSGNLDAVSCIGRVHHHSVTDIDADVTVETDQIARSCITEGINSDSVASLGSVIMRKTNAKVRIHCHRKAAAIGAVCKA